MDRNFTDDTVPMLVAWCIDGGSDNTTCKSINSEEEGTPLKHIQDTFGTNVKVSFPSVEQIAVADGKNYEDIPTIDQKWLWGSHSYWTSTPKTDSIESAWMMGGILDYTDPVDTSNLHGVRPVITLSKSQLG